MTNPKEPNTETEAAMAEPKGRTYESIEELFRDLDDETI